MNDGVWFVLRHGRPSYGDVCRFGSARWQDRAVVDTVPSDPTGRPRCRPASSETEGVEAEPTRFGRPLRLRFVGYLLLTTCFWNMPLPISFLSDFGRTDEFVGVVASFLGVEV